VKKKGSREKSVRASVKKRGTFAEDRWGGKKFFNMVPPSEGRKHKRRGAFPEGLKKPDRLSCSSSTAFLRMRGGGEKRL